MQRCPVACPDCGRPSAPGSRFCESHLVNNSAARHRRDFNKFRREHDEIIRWYDKPYWRTFRNWLWRQNPICQRLEAGQPCRNPSKIAHHLVSPRQRPDLFLEATNVVMLCSHHHPDSEGTPHWRVGVDYVATVAAAPSV